MAMAVSFWVNHQATFWQAAGQSGIGKPNDLMQRKRFAVGGFDNGHMTRKKPELLSPPSGSLDKMRAAQDLGADAVYAGQPRYSLRARNNELRLEQLQTGIHEAHARGRKLFACGQVVQPGVDQSVGRPGHPRLQQRFPGTPTGAEYAKLLHRHL
ncbi:hypothetical protein IWX85_002335 [Polaromonas sp. CG_9.11]|nr:hypothetical protein [Polaromonas sp. CG_9.11]MBG6076501.1 hypothetical protein [Polaromonas sp. CG_9.11]